MKIVSLCLKTMVLLQLSWSGLILFPSWIWGQTGVGPIPLRNQFPLSLRYLSLTPSSPTVLSPYDFRLSYQVAISNSFINTRGSSGDLSPAKVEGGIENEDYHVAAFGKPSNGYNLYLDVESYRHLWRFRMGLPYDLEVGVELPFLSFGGGWMDRPIEFVHNITGVDNYQEDGGFREKSERNRFDYYLIRGDRFIFKENKPFSAQIGDPVGDLKWQIFKGEPQGPSIALKLAYKFALDEAKHYPRHLISSGRPDYGMSLLLSQGFFQNQLIVYGQGGQTRLEQKNNDFSDQLNHAMLAAEYRASDQRSWLFQWVRQSSIFPGSSPQLDGIRETMIDSGLGESTDIVVIGARQMIHSWLCSIGFMEDLNQTRNEIDFVFFVEIEWIQNFSS